MNKVYVIMSGEYSDRCIEGYCESREEAERVCLQHNTGKGRYDDDWYIMETDKRW